MALLDNPRTSSVLAIFVAVLVGYIGYSGDGIEMIGLSGLGHRSERVAALQDTLTALEASIDSARTELARGTVEEVRQRVEEHRGTLAVLRELVPDRNEVPNLLDDISSRSKIRGVNLASVVPQVVEPGPSPFDTHAYDMAVIGRYDQIGLFLSDIAGLRRIIVPTDVSLTAADPAKARALGDSAGAMLEASFRVRTYVKAGGPDGM